MTNRRDILKAVTLGSVAAGLPGISFAGAETDARLVLVILRGAVDGLALAAPYGEGRYDSLRGELALPSPGNEGGSLKLDGLFGLHPALTNVYADYQGGQALLLHAVASPYRERSHFDGQDVLENGAAGVGQLRDGWLNRALEPLNGSSYGSIGREVAIAMAQNTPLVLRGDQSVTSWAPSRLPGVSDDTIARLQNLYGDDDFFSLRLAQAIHSQDVASGMHGSGGRAGRGNQAAQFRELMTSTARFLTAEDGPRIAVVELGGWDTHANQGTSGGQLANRFSMLDQGLDDLKRGLGDAWRSSVVAVVTEFGRTVRVNGTRGTDHGTASAALLLGGAVNGGKVIGDWPGLGAADLYEGRDLKPTTDLRSLFKGLLIEHLELSRTVVDRRVFPDSAVAEPLTGLIVS